MPRILIFDSGVGGLSVLHEIRRIKAQVPVTYVADNAFFPYGERTESELIERLPDLMKTLSDQYHPGVIVIACNTASTIALEEVRAAVSVPVVGTVPAIKPAALQTTSGVIGLLGTPGTVERLYTDELIADYAPDVHVVRHGSLELVHLAEEKLRGGDVHANDVEAVLTKLTDGERGSEMDTLVLACTHFPLLRDEISQILSPQIKVIDSGEAIARRTLEQLGLQVGHPVISSPGRNTLIFTAQDEGLRGLEPTLKALAIDQVEVLAD